MIRRAPRFPSPRPSPLGRRRVVIRSLDKSVVLKLSARRLPVSLSRRERAGVKSLPTRSSRLELWNEQERPGDLGRTGIGFPASSPVAPNPRGNVFLRPGALALANTKGKVPA